MLSRYQGFSFVEVLVSLVLVTGICFGLFTQQSHIAFLLRQARAQSHMVMELDNQSEHSTPIMTLGLGP